MGVSLSAGDCLTHFTHAILIAKDVTFSGVVDEIAVVLVVIKHGVEMHDMSKDIKAEKAKEKEEKEKTTEVTAEKEPENVAA